MVVVIVVLLLYTAGTTPTTSASLDVSVSNNDIQLVDDWGANILLFTIKIGFFSKRECGIGIGLEEVPVHIGNGNISFLQL